MKKLLLLLVFVILCSQIAFGEWYFVEESDIASSDGTWIDVANLTDGDYDTQGRGNAEGNLYQNYSCNGTIFDATWYVLGTDVTPDYSNSSLPSDCFQGSSIYTRLFSNDAATDKRKGYCWNFTSEAWVEIISKEGANKHHIYEDGMWCNSYMIDNCTDGQQHSINFTLMNTSADVFLKGDMNFVFDYGKTSLDYNYSLSLTDQGNASFCTFPNESWVMADIMVDYTVAGTSYSYFAYQINLTNNTRLVTLYATSGGTQVTFNVKDTGGDNIEDAYITIEKYDVGSNSYKSTEIVTTGYDGNAYAEIALGDWYRFTVKYAGTTYLVDGPVRQIATSKNFRINLLGADWYDDYEDVAGVVHSLTYDNTTLKFAFTWVDDSLDISYACLRVRQRNASQDTLLNNSCSASHSGTINMYLTDYVTNINDQTFIATAYFKMIHSPLTEIIAAVKEISFDYEWKIYDAKGGGFGLFMALLVVVALGFAGGVAAGPPGGVVGASLGYIMMGALNIIYISTGVIITIIILAAIVIWRTSNAK